MLNLRRNTKLSGRPPMQKLTRSSSRESFTDPSSSLSFSANDEFIGDFLNESPQRLVQATSDSIYTDDQVVIRPEEAEGPRIALHTSLENSERSGIESEVSKKKKKKTKQTKQSKEAGKGKSKKSATKTTASKTKKKQGAEKEEDSPFWSLMESGHQQRLSNISNKGRMSRALESEDSNDESFVSHDGSILVPSKASLEFKESTPASPKEGGRRNQRANVSTATGTVLMPSKASLERSESLKSNKSAKKKRRPKLSNDGSSTSLSSPNKPKSPTAGKQEKSASPNGKKASGRRSMSPKPPFLNNASLPPAIEGKPSSFSSMQFSSFGDSEEFSLGSPTLVKPEPSSPQDDCATKIKQPSKASLESMLERVTIRKKTRKGSGASVGSQRRGKRPQTPQLDSSDHGSVVSLDTGMMKSNNTTAKQARNSLSVRSRKNGRQRRTMPRRTLSYNQSELKEPKDQTSGVVTDDTTPSTKIKSRKTGSRRTERSIDGQTWQYDTFEKKVRDIKAESDQEQEQDEGPVASPKSIMKSKRRSSFGDDSSSSEPTKSKLADRRRASFNGNSKHPSLLSGYGGEKNEEATSSPKRRGVRSPPGKGRKPATSRSLSPMVKGSPASSTVKPYLEEDDPWDSIDEVFMPIKSGTTTNVVQESSSNNDSSMWGSLEPLDESEPLLDVSTRSEPCRRSMQWQHQQLKATEFMDAWWDVNQEEDDRSLSDSKRKKLSQMNELLLSSSSIQESMKSSEFFEVEEKEDTQDLPKSVSTADSNSPLTKHQKSKPKQQVVEAIDGWWAEDAGDAQDTKKKQLARKSVLMVGGNNSKNMKNQSFWDSDGEEEEEEETPQKAKVVIDFRTGRRVVQYAGGRRPSASPGRLAVNRRRMSKQPVSKTTTQPPEENPMGSPQERQQKKVASAFQF